VKIRTLQQLEDRLDSETGWRKRELTSVRFDAESARSRKLPTVLRGGVALLYAHWEGWIKRVAEHYVAFVIAQKLTYGELSDSFLALSLKARMDDFAHANRSTVNIAFAAFLRNDLDKQARFGSRRAIQTDSNLNSEILHRILMSLGIDSTPYDMHARLIDQQMLKRRNQIAHGEYLNLGLDDFLILHSKVTELLSRFTSDVLNGAAQGAFRTSRFD